MLYEQLDLVSLERLKKLVYRSLPVLPNNHVISLNKQKVQTVYSLVFQFVPK